MDFLKLFCQVIFATCIGLVIAFVLILSIDTRIKIEEMHKVLIPQYDTTTIQVQHVDSIIEQTPDTINYK